MKVKSTTFFIGLFFFNMIVIPNGTTVSRIFKLAFVGLSAIYIISKRDRFRWCGHFTWLFLFTVLSFASIYWAASREHAARGVSTIALNSVCVIMLGMVLLNVENWAGIVVPCLCILPSILLLRLLIIHGFSVFGGLRNVEGGMHNTVGMYAGFGASFSVFYIYYCGMHKRVRRAAKWWVLFGINSLICMLTMSRKAMIYLFLPLFFGLLFSGKNITKKIRNVLGIVLGIVIIYNALMHIPVLYNYVGKGVENALNYFMLGTGDTSAAGRNTRISYGMLMFSHRPWIGYGAMNYNYLFYNFEPLTQMIIADNNFIDVAVNSGIIGLVLYYSIYAVNILTYIRKGRHSTFVQVFPFAVLLTLLIADYGVSAYLYLHSQTYLMMAVLIIYQAAGGRKKERIRSL